MIFQSMTILLTIQSMAGEIFLIGNMIGNMIGIPTVLQNLVLVSVFQKYNKDYLYQPSQM